MISHLPGKCLDMHASLGSGFVHSSVDVVVQFLGDIW